MPDGELYANGPMRKPKMILFDYGHTLFAEKRNEALDGIRAVMRHAVRNPLGLTPEQVNERSAALFFGICKQVRDIGAELHNRHFLKLLYEPLGIGFSISLLEQERIFWDHMSPGTPMPHIRELLDCLKARGIRSGVISNIGFSGEALRDRIDRGLPGNAFEFAIASSEYMVRKPNPLLFELALSRAGLPGRAVWYCGDNPVADVMGAHGAGIFPVWYRSGIPSDFPDERYDRAPECPYLEIRDWLEMAGILEGLEG